VILSQDRDQIILASTPQLLLLRELLIRNTYQQIKNRHSGRFFLRSIIYQIFYHFFKVACIVSDT